MRRLVFALVLASNATACTEDDPAPVYVEVDYKVRCLDCTPRAQDDPVRNISALDGERDFTTRCDVARRSGGRVVTFEAVHSDPGNSARNYSFRVSQVPLDGSPGVGCSVRVVEGSNRYEGRCTDGEPDADRPCQVEVEVEDGIVTGSVHCVRIPNTANASVHRYVTAPRSAGRSASFEVHGCDGL
jgi:hypothetical protein